MSEDNNRKKTIDETIGRSTSVRRGVSWFSPTELAKDDEGKTRRGVAKPIGFIPIITALLVGLVKRWNEVVEFSVTLAEAEERTAELSGDERTEAEAKINAGREQLTELRKEAGAEEEGIEKVKMQLAHEMRRLDTIGPELALLRGSIEDEIKAVQEEAQKEFLVGQGHHNNLESTRAEVRQLEKLLAQAETNAAGLEGSEAEMAEQSIALGREELTSLTRVRDELQAAFSAADIKEKLLRSEIEKLRKELLPIEAEERAILRLRSEVAGAEKEWEELAKERLRIEHYEANWRNIPTQWACAKCEEGVEHPLSGMFHLSIEKIWEAVNTSNPVLSIVFRLSQEDGAKLLRCAKHRPPYQVERSYRLMETILGAPELRERMAAKREEKKKEEEEKNRVPRMPKKEAEEDDSDRAVEIFLGFKPERGIGRAKENPHKRHQAVLNYARKHGMWILPTSANVAGLEPAEIDPVISREERLKKAVQAAQSRIAAALKRAEETKLKTELELKQVDLEKAGIQYELARLTEKLQGKNVRPVEQAKTRNEVGKLELRLAMLEEEADRVKGRVALAARLLAQAEQDARREEVEYLEELVRKNKAEREALLTEADKLEQEVEEEKPTENTQSTKTSKATREANAKASQYRAEAELALAKARAEVYKKQKEADIQAASKQKDIELARAQAEKAQAEKAVFDAKAKELELRISQLNLQSERTSDEETFNKLAEEVENAEESRKEALKAGEASTKSAKEAADKLTKLQKEAEKAMKNAAEDILKATEAFEAAQKKLDALIPAPAAA